MEIPTVEKLNWHGEPFQPHIGVSEIQGEKYCSPYMSLSKQKPYFAKMTEMLKLKHVPVYI